MDTGASKHVTGIVMPPHIARYHGAPEDPRYPSPRSMRAFVAGSVDFCLSLATFLGSVLALIALREDSGVIVAAALALPVIAVIVVNAVLLPAWIHASLGDLVFGLVKIRSSDGGQPTIADLARNVWNPGSGRDTIPAVVQVRRRDTRTTA
ncbi:hypothetical protein ACWF9G_01160 [Nocardia sp. NPDC055029]